VAINNQWYTGGLREEDLQFLDNALSGDDHLVRIVLNHSPPSFGDHFSPHTDWFHPDRDPNRETEFMEIYVSH